MIIGYTTGVYDLFHIGHLNLLRNAKGLCDKLIVGVARDEIVTYKSRKIIIPFEDRIEIVRSIKYVDMAIPQDSIDVDYKFSMWQRLHFDVIFAGDDWFGVQRWQDLETKFATVGVKVVYFPYTKGVSSTLISQTLNAQGGLGGGYLSRCPYCTTIGVPPAFDDIHAVSAKEAA